MPNIQNTYIKSADKNNILLDFDTCHVFAGDMDYFCNPGVLKEYNEQNVEQIIETFHDYLTYAQNTGIKLVSLYFRKNGLTEVEALRILGSIMNYYKEIGFMIHFFDPKAVIALLEVYSGIPLLNALTSEKSSQEKGISLLKEVNCPIVIQPIDDYGIPLHENKRLEVISEVVRNFEEKGISRELIYVDSLSPSIYFKPCELDVSIKTIRMSNELNLKTILWPENTARGYSDTKNKIAQCYTTMAIDSGLKFSVVRINPFELFPYIKYANKIKNGVFYDE